MAYLLISPPLNQWRGSFASTFRLSASAAMRIERAVDRAAGEQRVHGGGLDVDADPQPRALLGSLAGRLLPRRWLGKRYRCPDPGGRARHQPTRGARAQPQEPAPRSRPRAQSRLSRGDPLSFV